MNERMDGWIGRYDIIINNIIIIVIIVNIYLLPSFIGGFTHWRVNSSGLRLNYRKLEQRIFDALKSENWI